MPLPWICAAILAALPAALATAQEASDPAAPPSVRLHAVQMMEEEASDLAALPATEDVPEEEGEETAVQTPMLLAPVDAWREDPSAILSAVDVSLEDFRWIARPVVVFADSEADPAFQQQMKFLTARMDALAERDVVVLTDTDPSAMSDVRRQLRPRGFMLALLSKEGDVVLRKPSPWDVRELTRSIDKMPQRRQEIRERENPNL